MHDLADFYFDKHVKKTRKDRRCYDCGGLIEKGSEALKSCTLLHGQFLHGYFCYNCVPHKKPKAIESNESAQPKAEAEK